MNQTDKIRDVLSLTVPSLVSKTFAPFISYIKIAK